MRDRGCAAPSPLISATVHLQRDLGACTSKQHAVHHFKPRTAALPQVAFAYSSAGLTVVNAVVDAMFWIDLLMNFRWAGGPAGSRKGRGRCWFCGDYRRFTGQPTAPSRATACLHGSETVFVSRLLLCQNIRLDHFPIPMPPLTAPTQGRRLLMSVAASWW
jgi:hypothetical protein